MTTSSDLRTLLQSEILAVKRFVELLRSEQALLQVGDATSLNRITSEKSELIDRLGELAADRNAILVATGFATDGDGLESWVKNGDATAREMRESLLALAAEAKELNRLNGQLIALRLTHTQEALNALTAGQARTALYGRDGQTSSPTGYRIIDSA